MSSRMMGAVALLAAFVSTNALAANEYVGANGGDWETPGNWSLERVPGSSDDVVISDHAVNVGTAVSVKSLTVSGASTVTFNAVALPDGQASTAANIYASPTVIAVSGAFSIEDTATVICANEPKTGAAVRFDVGSLTLAKDAKISSDGQSWQWYQSYSVDPLATYVQGNYKCRAMGAGGDDDTSKSYDRGAGYGAAGGNATGEWGKEYGFKCAPFLPGSPNGLYGGAIKYGFRGGGTVWIRCAGRCEINGAVTANGLDAQFGAPSGGGIWICADSFAAGENASLSAIGGNMTGNTVYQSVSAGGRISIGTGLSIAQQDALASGATPEAAGVASVDRIDEIATSVKGGYKTGAPTQFGNSGTVTRVRGSMKVDFVLSGKGQVVADGVTHTEDFSLTVSCADGVSLKATATDGARFVSWSGAPVPEGFDEAAETLLKPVDDGTVTVAFVEGVVRRVWTGRVSDDIAAPANWTPASTMTAEDELYVTNGTLTASAPFAAGKLVLAGETTFTAKAVPLGDGIASTSANLYANPTVLTVAGEFLVDDATTVVCENDPKTGAAVRFDVGSLTLAEGATITSDARGWNWYLSSGDALATYTQGKYQSRALGAGGDDTSGNAWMQAAGHGVAGSRYSGTRVHYGDAYGQELAPFEPGSPNGLQNHSINNGTTGGGTVWIRCGGTCAVAGTITANGGQAQYSSGSGGSIWISAKTFESAETAVLSVRGGDMTGSTIYPAGAGGRIAVATGLTVAQLDALAVGETAESLGLVVLDAVAGLATDVRGGRKTSAAKETYDQASGTVRRILGSVALEVAFAGKGQVTVGETTYTESFTVDVSTKDGVTLVASGLDGSTFVSWEGAPLADGFSEDAQISFVPQGDGQVLVNFAEGAVKRTWAGVDDGDFFAPLNWSPAGTVAATDEIYLTNAVLSLSRGLSVGKLVIAGESELTFNAVPLADGLASTTSNLYASPTVIAVAGEMAVEAGAKVICANDPKTGAAVRFDVGSFRLSEGAVVSADGQGWFWYKSSGDPLATCTQGTYQCRAMGAGGDSNTGMSYNRGAGYGAAVGNASAPYGVEYGLKHAPFLPGSPNGLHSATLGNGVRGGGTVWIRCAGVCELDGTISANGVAAFYGAPSGGGIWLSAKGLKASASASLSANGGDMTGSSTYLSTAAGGRISLAIGVSNEQLDALARGETPADVTCADEITLVSASVRGSRKTQASAPTYGNSGTMTTVTGPYAYVNVTVAGSPVDVRGCEPACGSPSFEGGSVQTFTAPAFGADMADGRFGYTCAGYVVSNEQGEVKSGPGLSVEATIEKGLSVTWLWKDPQKRVFVAKPAHGALTVDGVVQPGDVTLWTDGDFAPIGVVADDGYEFVCWSGKVPLGTVAANPLAVTATEPLTLGAVIRPVADPTIRTWNGTGVWTDAANWTPAGIPGAGDTLVIASGACAVPNGLVAAALQVTGGALLVGTTGDVNAEVAVAGDMTVAGGQVVLGYDKAMKGHARLAVGGDLTLGSDADMKAYGGPLADAYTFATGSSFIEVGGVFALEAGSTLSLYSDYSSGGSVKITATDFTVAEGATVDAKEKGFMWLDAVTPPNSPGVGYTYTRGASHGGIGNGWGGEVPAYDQAKAPVMPGSPNGVHESLNNCTRGGGVIRVHAARLLSVAGTLTADAKEMNGYGGASGGSIWLTAEKLDFAPTAVLTAKGCGSGLNGATVTASYGSMGAGGRIAIEGGLTAAQIETLAETGEGITRRVRDEAKFMEIFPGVDVRDAVRGGKEYAKDGVYGAKGSFVFLPAPKGLMLLVR